MKKLMVVVALGVTTLLTSSLIANAAQPATAEAELDPINDSGIHARIVFLDMGSPDNVLVIKGTATGLDTSKGQVYFSLVYNIGSVAEGPGACLPAPPPAPQITFNQMTTAFWRTNPDGTGTLLAVKSGAFYVPLDRIGTMSIRQATPGSNPPFFDVLRACGDIQQTSD